MVKDYTGQEIKVDDWLIRAYNLGRCAALKYAKVLSLTDTGKLVTIGFTTNKSWKGKGFKPDDGKGIVSYPDRTMVIDESKVPKEVIEAWKNY